MPQRRALEQLLGLCLVAVLASESGPALVRGVKRGERVAASLRASTAGRLLTLD